MRWLFGLSMLMVTLLFAFGAFVAAAPGIFATKPIPDDRAAWIDTEDGLARCYYSKLTADWIGCVRR